MTDEPSGASSPSVRTIRLTISYDGTAYCGWETQRNGLAIQPVVEDALFAILRERIAIVGSGRTDAGVHALGQVASFATTSNLTPRKLRLGMNAVLPRDISILEVAEVPSAFHARFSAVSKTYRYTILNAPARRPLERHREYHFPQALDVSAMQVAAATLVGTHDFRAFAKEAARRRNCVRTILRATVLGQAPRIEIELHGTGFLYNMVRIITGTLIEVGLCRRPVTTFTEVLGGKARADAGYTVPPHGLCLMSVDYPAELSPFGQITIG